MYNASCTCLTNLSQKSFWMYFNTFDTILTGCEGILWNGDIEIKGSPETLNRLRDIGKQIFFITNNSMRTRDEFVTHAKSMGFKISREEVISSSYLTVHYLKTKNFQGIAYVIGSRGLVEELKAYNINYIGPGPEQTIGQTIEEICNNIEFIENVEIVVVGLDEHFSMVKLIKAVNYLLNPNCEFIAVSAEERRSGYSPKVSPATGSIVAAIETSSGRKAKIIGKPSSYVGEYLKRNHCVDPDRTLLFGDRLRLDILLGNVCGFQTLLVLSGLTHSEELDTRKLSALKDDSEVTSFPNLYTNKLEDLLLYLKLKEY